MHDATQPCAPISNAYMCLLPGGDTCVRRVRDLGSMDAEGMRMLPVACPKDYVRADVGTSAVYSEVVIGKVMRSGRV